MKPLTRKQKETEAYVREYIAKHRRKPTYQQVADHFSIGRTAAFSRCKHLQEMQTQLPSGIDMDLLRQLLVYSDRYQINIQFWPDTMAVYIQKNDVELCDFGGDFEFAIKSAISYLKRITKS